MSLAGRLKETARSLQPSKSFSLALEGCAGIITQGGPQAFARVEQIIRPDARWEASEQLPLKCPNKRNKASLRAQRPFLTGTAGGVDACARLGWPTLCGGFARSRHRF